MTKSFASLITLIFLANYSVCSAQDPTQLKLRDYRPQSIYRIPVTIIKKAKFPAIDMHSHDFARTDEEVMQWVKTMDDAGIEKTIILSGAIGTRPDSI